MRKLEVESASIEQELETETLHNELQLVSKILESFNRPSNSTEQSEKLTNEQINKYVKLQKLLKLTATEQLMLALIYTDNKSIATVAKALHKKNSEVKKVHKQCLGKIRLALEKEKIRL